MIPSFKPSMPPYDEVEKALKDIWQTGQVSNFGKYCKLFEDRIKKYTGADYVVAVSNCDTALTLCASILFEEASTVCLPTFTFNSTYTSLLWSEKTPLLLDVNKDSLLIDLNLIEDIAKNKNIKNFVLVNIFGNMYNHEDLNFLSNKYGLNLLFDAAHSFGSSLKSKKSGNWGTECFSFSGTKPIVAGEGGVICTDNKSVYDKLLYLRNYGFKDDYNLKYLGCNGKISEINSAIGAASVGIIESVLERKNQIVNLYKELLPGYKFQKNTLGVKSSYKALVLLDIERRKIEPKLKLNNIHFKNYFLPLHRQEMIKNQNHQFNNQFECADHIYDTSICIPSHCHLTDEQVKFIAEVIKTA